MADDFRELPPEDHEKEIAVLVGHFLSALRQIESLLLRLDLTNITRANVADVHKKVASIIADLDAKVADWVTTNIPKAAEDGIVRSAISLGYAENAQQAREVIKVNRVNSEFIKTAVADTQDDLLQVSQNVSRKVRTAVRQVTAEAMRANLDGMQATDTLKRNILSELRKRLGDSLDTGIIDAAGRRWKPEVYTETVVRTKMAQAQREAAINDGVGRGAYYGVISAHGATDACRNWEHKIVKLTADAPGSYPYIGELPNREIFHPRCKHVVSPIRRPDRLPGDIRDLNGVE
jgi:hypothetical protein